MLTKAAATLMLVILCPSLEWYAARSPEPQRTIPADRKLAVAIVRAINTAEMASRSQTGGTFAEWADLSQSPAFTAAIERFSRGNPKIKQIDFRTASEIIPDWIFRLTVSADRRSYVIVFADSSDKACAYALVSAEDGLIREARVIGCPSS